jgi:modulator of FtsH protease HflC
MKTYLQMAAGLFLLAFFILAMDCVYTVDETQQAVITQFGDPIGRPVTEAGLKFKLPFVQMVHYFDKRILRWDGEPNQIPTADKRFIWVDTTARWRIVDALKFKQTVGTETGAHAKLDNIIESSTRDTISNFALVEAVRNSNRLIDQVKQMDSETDFDMSDAELEKIKTGREELTRRILQSSSEIIRNYGIELVDVRIKRVNYVQEVRDSIYQRMMKEREAAAERYLSEGQGKKAEIEGQMQKEKEEIESKAYRTAQEIIGKADAEAIKIYADAYSKDPELYNFLKTLETYRDTTDKNTVLILSTDTEFYEYLRSIHPGKLP